MQEYIENENGRLEREQQFWSKEIVVKIEYKYCPNLTIIDTPGNPFCTPLSYYVGSTTPVQSTVLNPLRHGLLQLIDICIAL